MYGCKLLCALFEPAVCIVIPVGFEVVPMGEGDPTPYSDVMILEPCEKTYNADPLLLCSECACPGLEALGTWRGRRWWALFRAKPESRVRS